MWSPATTSCCASCGWVRAPAGASKCLRACAGVKGSPPIRSRRCRRWRGSARPPGPAMTEHARLGLPTRLAAAFHDNPLAPVLALLGRLLGRVAVLVTPRAEGPQMRVTTANVIGPFQGAAARDGEQLVATPLEPKPCETEGRKHVYSDSRPGVAVLTVEYEVGIER